MIEIILSVLVAVLAGYSFYLRIENKGQKEQIGLFIEKIEGGDQAVNLFKTIIKHALDAASKSSFNKMNKTLSEIKLNVETDEEGNYKVLPVETE